MLGVRGLRRDHGVRASGTGRDILDPNEVRISHASSLMRLSHTTQLRWVPITRDFSSNIDHREARAVMRAFYQGMADIRVSHELSQPHEIEASTGM